MCRLGHDCAFLSDFNIAEVSQTNVQNAAENGLISFSDKFIKTSVAETKLSLAARLITQIKQSNPSHDGSTYRAAYVRRWIKPTLKKAKKKFTEGLK